MIFCKIKSIKFWLIISKKITSRYSVRFSRLFSSNNGPRVGPVQLIYIIRVFSAKLQDFDYLQLYYHAHTYKPFQVLVLVGENQLPLLAIYLYLFS